MQVRREVEKLKGGVSAAASAALICHCLTGNTVTRLPTPFSIVPALIVWYTSWLNADVKSYKLLQFGRVPNTFALMFLLWIALFTTWNGESKISQERTILDMVMTALVGLLETQDSDPH